MLRYFVGLLARISSGALMAMAAGIAAVIWQQLLVGGNLHNTMDHGIGFIVIFDAAIAVVGILCLLFWKGVANVIFG